MLERGLEVDHSTINRWVLHYALELDRRCRSHLKSTNDSWRVDETCVKVKKQWKYLYRAVDSQGNTIDFLLTARRDTEAAKRFFIKASSLNYWIFYKYFRLAYYLRHNRKFTCKSLKLSLVQLIAGNMLA